MSYEMNGCLAIYIKKDVTSRIDNIAITVHPSLGSRIIK